mmetsp:Transcript_55459/g.134658  ORF Transcript_55459/g.134658 Transcript_55459/m.134658 type:complete len:588 (-) Transcript_55459:79-1842(-)
MKKKTNSTMIGFLVMATVVFATTAVATARRNDRGGDSPEEALQKYGWTIVAIIVACIVGLLSLSMSLSKNKKKDRSWSFTSRAMGLGSFPRKVEFHEPIINAVLVFDTAKLPTMEDILKSVEELTTKYDRFGKVYDPIKDQTIGTQKDFDISDLVRVVEFDSSTMAAGKNHDDNADTVLMKVMEDHALDPLSRDPRGKLLPWWEFLILKDTAPPSQGLMPWSKSDNKSKSAVVWRVHHAIGDGISLINVVQDIFVDTSGHKLSGLLPKNLSHKLNKKRSAIDWVTDFISSTVTGLGVPTSKFDDNTLFYSRPKSPSQMLYPTQFGIYSFEPVSLHFVKHLKKAACTKLTKSDSKTETVVTINDILFSVTSQAIHDYLQSNHDPVLANHVASNKEDFQFRALLPVAIPRPAGTHPLRNLWCFVSVDLSVGVNGILQRLASIHETMSGLKNSLVPAVMMGLQTYVLPLFPLWFNRDQVVQIFSRHSVVASNVPGPPIQCVFANQPVQAVHMVHCNLIPQLSFLSYHGMVYGNFTMGVNDEGEGSDKHGQRKRDELLPMYISRAFVDLANELDESDEIPPTILDHASRHK